MVITIDNIRKLVGCHFHNRTIQDISLSERFGKGSASYVFHFDAIPSIHVSLNKKWEDEFEVHLYRSPKQNGKYELFVMGLHGVTCEELYWKDIQNFSEFYSYIYLVIGRAKKYWDEAKNYWDETKK
jgi:hypothetical protein